MARSRWGAVFAAAALAACSSSTSEPASSSSGGAAGSASNAGAHGGSAGSTGSGGASVSGGNAAAGGGNTIGPSNDSGATDTGSVERGSSTEGGADAGHVHEAGQIRDHCVDGYLPDARDALITSLPDEWRASNGDIDLVVPQGVLDWMGERAWEQSHDAWHNVRRCKGSVLPGGNICMHTELVPAHQECADAEDGYEFLVMHRHMMQALKQAFPQHADLFQGFPTFPLSATDVPEQWRSRWGTGWSQQIKDTAAVLEDIEQRLSQFPAEGDLGKYIQCGTMSSGASSIHGALHFKWVVNESPHSLGKQPVNIDNYMFWKLHGWIDRIWERYRLAKVLTPDEPKLKQALVDQCVGMHQLGLVFDPSIGKQPDAPLPVEHGYFHETVRPILERICSGCHSESSPEANMSLGGHISSADVVKGLVGVTSLHGGQFKRVLAGNADQSWLYLKVSGRAAAAGCTGTMCNAQVMPPTGQVTLSQTELDAIRQWITTGAPAPTP